MWEIYKHITSGSQSSHSLRTAESQDAAVSAVLQQLSWQRDSNGLRFVNQDGEPCYEDEATCDLEGGRFACTQGQCTVVYSLREAE